jgi:mRNA-degrading endonuclease RelE of RelBE toxin-antitoxin system
MIQPTILEKLEKLPESLQTEVLHYIEFLLEKQTTRPIQEETPKKRRLAGSMKGTFVLPLPDNFDEPLEEFEDYM